MRITLVSSKERCGIQTYANALAAGFRENGWEVDQVGVGWWDTPALLRASGQVARDSTIVVIEHEFALYRNLALVAAMARLRLAGKRVVLSMHELEPDKFVNYHKIVGAIHERLRGGPSATLLRIGWLSLVAAQRLFRYRLTLWLFGALPERVVVHSARTLAHAGLLTGDERKLVEVPHFVEPLDGAADPAGSDDPARRRELRARLGLPLDRFIFVSPGFLFRRKRLVEVVRSVPADATLVLAGTESRYEGEYLAEIRRAIEERGLGNVVIDTDYARMPDHLMAADAVVLFYKLAFQSGIAAHAIWAEKPCVFSDDPAFDPYRGAGLRAADERELREAMIAIQTPEVALPLRARARELKSALSPKAMAARYLEGMVDPRATSETGRLPRAS